jgi:hypothetical protein
MRSAAVLLSTLRSSARASSDRRKPRHRECETCSRHKRLAQRIHAHAIGAARRRTERPPRRRERPLRRVAVLGFAGVSVH